jgi:hypothetical protein
MTRISRFEESQERGKQYHREEDMGLSLSVAVLFFRGGLAEEGRLSSPLSLNFVQFPQLDRGVFCQDIFAVMLFLLS